MTNSLNAPISYSDAGVHIDAADASVTDIKTMSQQTHTHSAVLSGVGGFAAMFDLNAACPNLKEPVLVSATDGVGTKVLLALENDNIDNLGQDLLAMCSNDLLVCGAKPLFFLDYLAMGRFSKDTVSRLVKSISLACQKIGCALVGGETAEMPGVYQNNHFDMAGFCVGVVEKKSIIDARDVVPGDVILGLPSSGPHSNGFSLIRKIVDERIQDASPKLIDSLLKPTTLYHPPIMKILSEGYPIKGMAHITGGGIANNLGRPLRDGHCAEIDITAMTVPPVFQELQKAGNVSETEMRRVFNMGLGFALFVSSQEANQGIRLLESLGIDAAVIGEVTARHTQRVCFV